MSRFFSPMHSSLTPYTPGEQPRGEVLVKLNTNESPFPPSPSVLDAIAGAVTHLNLYSDPQGVELRTALASYHGVSAEQISLGNGSDETLAFAFTAFGDAEHGFVFPDVTYGFYPVFSRLFGVAYEEFPLSASLEINVDDYLNTGRNVIIANPNAPTGIALQLSEIERIAASNPDRVVIIDEAYIDFAGADATAVPLVAKFDNLLVVRTYSKSRNLAGARLGYAVGSPELIADLETIRYSFNPYNVNSLTLAAGAAALQDNDFYAQTWDELARTRDKFAAKLRALGIEVTQSRANFVFAKHPKFSGSELQKMLRERGFLVRNLGPARIRDWLRITIGTRDNMNNLAKELENLL